MSALANIGYGLALAARLKACDVRIERMEPRRSITFTFAAGTRGIFLKDRMLEFAGIPRPVSECSLYDDGRGYVSMGVAS